MSLLPKQQAFAQAYAAEPNATQAAIAAGYSPASARTTGSRLLNDPAVSAAIDAARTELAERNAIQADEVVAGLRAIVEDWRSGNANAQAAVAALDKLAKIAGAYEADNTQERQFRVVWGDED